jgi:hypothetical protein
MSWPHARITSSRLEVDTEEEERPSLHALSTSPPPLAQNKKGQCGCFLVDTWMNKRYEQEEQLTMACRYTLAADAEEKELMESDSSDRGSPRAKSKQDD